VLTETLIAEVYGVEARVTIGQEGRPVITVLGPVPVASVDFQSERDAGNDV